MKKLLLNDRFIIVLILLNATIIVLQGYESSTTSTEVLKYLDTIFTLIFAIEAATKITHSGWQSFISDGWNKLDFVLVLLTLPSAIADFLPVSDISLSYLLAFRVLRVLKIIRFFKIVPNIEHLFKGIQNALRSSIIVFIGFFVYVFVIGVLSNALYSEAAPEYFGSPINSFYTIFKLFTVEGWYEIPESINIEKTIFSIGVVKMYFSIIVLTGGILGLSLVNSIFVDSMLSDNNDHLENKIDFLTNEVSKLTKQIESFQRH